MNQPLHVHFICRGNVYRSRIAAEYLDSMKVPGVVVSSSGIEANRNERAAIAHLPVSIAQAAGESSWDNFGWLQTSQELLDNSDMLVFLNADIAEQAAADYSFVPEKAETWDVANLDEALAKSHTSQSDLSAAEAEIALTIQRIHTLVDGLVHDIAISGIVDVVDEHNQPLDYRLPLAWVDKKGLWYRSCHGVVVTADDRFVVEKRSKDIVFSPNLLDITFGGGIGAGENPLQAIVREGQEELGIDFTHASVTDLGIQRFSSFHPRYQLHTRCFIYNYFIRLPEAAPVFHLEASEVAAVHLLTAVEIRELLDKHQLDPYGSLNTDYAYYDKLFENVWEQFDTV
jgi:8-oxo-dGTP pyrophosphatase MutT (NUDIX family)/protein-tyrosine-phosphatase